MSDSATNVDLMGADGAALGRVPLIQAEAYAQMSGHTLTVDGDSARLGGPCGSEPLPWRITTEYPTALAAPYLSLLREQHPYTRLHRLRDVFEASVEFVAVVMLHDCLDAAIPSTRLGRALLDRFPRPLTSAWIDLFEVARAARMEAGGPAQVPALLHLPLDRLARPLLEFRNRLAHTSIPADDACDATFAEALPTLHDLLASLAGLADHPLVEVGNDRARRWMGSTPGPWGGVPVPPGAAAGHLVIGGARWMDLHPLLLVEEERLGNLLPVFFYAGLGARSVSFSSPSGHAMRRAELYAPVVRRYVPGWRPGRRQVENAPLDQLFARYGKYEVLDLAARGALRIEALLDAVRLDPGGSASLVEAALDATRRLQASVQVPAELLDAAIRSGAAADGAGLRMHDGTLAPRPLPSSTRPLPTELPPTNAVRAPTLFGREGLLRVARDALATSALVTLQGMGGVGKTAAARALVEEAGERGHVYEIGLVSVTSVAEATDRVCAALGCDPPSSPDGVAGVVARHVAGRAVLLLLDNLEHLLEAAPVEAGAWVEALAGQVLGPRVLVTSRRRVGVPREVVVDVPPLDHAASLALIRAAADVALPEARITDVALCAHGHPLALRLLARRAVDRPDEDVDRLIADVGEVLQRTLLRSWTAASDDARRLLGALVVSPAGVGDWLTAAMGMSAQALVDAAAQGLATRAADRWTAHEVVRQGLLTRIDVAATVASLRPHWRDALHHARSRHDAGTPTLALRWFVAEEANVGAMLRQLPPEDAASWLVDAEVLYTWTGLGAVGLVRLDAVDRSGLPVRLGARLARVEATLAYFVGRHVRAVDAAQRAIDAPDPDDVHLAHYILSAASRALGRLDVAAEHMVVAHAICRSRDLRSPLANAWKELGVIADERGRPDEACANLEAAIVVYDSIARPIARAFAVQCLGVAEGHRGDHRRAETLARAALAEGRSLGEARVQGYAHLDLAGLLADRGAVEEARRALDDAEACFRAVHHRSKLAEVDVVRARVLRLGGDWGAAWRLLDTIAPARRDGELYVAIERARVLREVGRGDDAQELLDTLDTSALPWPRVTAMVATVRAELGESSGAVAAWEGVGDAWRVRETRLGAGDDPASILDEAITVGDARVEVRAAAILAERALRAGLLVEAGGWADHAAQCADKVGSAWERAWVREIVARHRAASAPGPAADLLLRTAAKVWLEIGDSGRAAALMAALSDPTHQEAELADFFTATSRSQFQRGWTVPALTDVCDRHRVLLAIDAPPAALLARVTAKPAPLPGGHDLSTLAETWLIRVLARVPKRSVRGGS